MANVRAVLALGKRYEDLLRDALALGPIHHPDMGADFPQRRVEMRKQPYSEHEQHLADGRWVRVREGRMPDGGLVLLTSDITRQRSLEAELRQAEKLKAVGTLASGIAHDFNNILATIFTSTEVALLQLPRDAPARAPLDRVMSAGERGRQLVGRDPHLQPQRADAARGDRPGRRRRLRDRLLPPRDRPRGRASSCAPTSRPTPSSSPPTRARSTRSSAISASTRRRPCRTAARSRSGSRATGGRDGQRCAPSCASRDTGSGMDAETASARLRALLHHQASRRGHRPRPGRRPWHGAGAGRPDQAADGAGPGQRVRDLPCRASPQRAPAHSRRSRAPSRPGRAGPCSWSSRTTEAAEAVAAMLRGAGYRVTRHTAGPSRARGLFRVTASRRCWWQRSRPAPRDGHRARLGHAPACAQAGRGPPAPRAASTPEELAAAEALPATVVAKPVLRRELAAALVAQVARSRGTPLPHRAAS